MRYCTVDLYKLLANMKSEVYWHGTGSKFMGNILKEGLTVREHREVNYDKGSSMQSMNNLYLAKDPKGAYSYARSMAKKTNSYPILVACSLLPNQSMSFDEDRLPRARVTKYSLDLGKYSMDEALNRLHLSIFRDRNEAFKVAKDSILSIVPNSKQLDHLFNKYKEVFTDWVIYDNLKGDVSPEYPTLTVDKMVINPRIKYREAASKVINILSKIIPYARDRKTVSSTKDIGYKGRNRISAIYLCLTDSTDGYPAYIFNRVYGKNTLDEELAVEINKGSHAFRHLVVHANLRQCNENNLLDYEDQFGMYKEHVVRSLSLAMSQGRKYLY